jgi:hypothetical protein
MHFHAACLASRGQGKKRGALQELLCFNARILRARRLHPFKTQPL